MLPCSKKQKSLRSAQTGFTLIELILVMAVLGVLTSIVMIGYPSAQKRARDSQRMSDLNQYRSALEVYANANEGSYPAAGATLQQTCTAELSSFTSGCPDDPKTPTQPSYGYVIDGIGYYIYAKLESLDTTGGEQWQYFCSNGSSGVTSSEPTSSPC